MTSLTAKSHDDITALASTVLASLEGLTVTQVRNVLNEAERLTNAYAAQVCSTTLFQPDAAKQSLGEH